MAASTRIGPADTDIVFDLGGVLIDWDPRYLFRDRLGQPVEVVERFLTDVCTPAWQGQVDGGRRFDDATRMLIEQHPEHRQWIHRYRSDWELMFRGEHAGTVELLHRLAAAGYRLHALSNYPGEHIAFLYRRFPFMSAFHTVVVSGLVGLAKPDAAVFRYLLERAAPRRCLLIDDRPDNVAEARRCGLLAARWPVERGAVEAAALS